MTTTAIAALIWAAFALGAYIAYKITDTHWRKKIKGMQDSLSPTTPAHGIPLREGTVCKGGVNTEPSTPRSSTPPQASRPKTVTSHTRGHLIYWDEDRKAWFYADDQTPISQERPCMQCRKMPTPEGHDPCLGHIPGAIGACCGHGVEDGFIKWDLHRPPTTPSPASSPEAQRRFFGYRQRLDQAHWEADLGVITHQEWLDVVNAIRSEEGFPPLLIPAEVSTYTKPLNPRLDVKA